MFDKLKNTFTQVKQNALVKMGYFLFVDVFLLRKSEEFKESEDFQIAVSKFKASRLMYIDLLKSGKELIEKQSAASQAKLTFVFFCCCLCYFFFLVKNIF
jgi:hypothetical protein